MTSGISTAALAHEFGLPPHRVIEVLKTAKINPIQVVTSANDRNYVKWRKRESRKTLHEYRGQFPKYAKRKLASASVEAETCPGFDDEFYVEANAEISEIIAYHRDSLSYIENDFLLQPDLDPDLKDHLVKEAVMIKEKILCLEMYLKTSVV